ncbi:ABC transporter substrate-binding protein [Streptomyces sp. NPDC060194]|uniref:ABC transporter substrate-binding protein n=1 Tax=Streptomyces sp. NPDC060194 TaxID=3347069 RepID=UPI00365EAE9C
MKLLTSRRARAAMVALAAGSLVLTGCSDDGGSGKNDAKTVDKNKAAEQQAGVQFGDAAASTGPAEELEGAKPGGTIAVRMQDDLSHLDPGQIYVSDAGLLSRLIHRGLTQNQEDGKGGVTVVGDLATDSGKPSEGGKVWTYTLKDGVKDANGNPITSADIRHSVERLYATFITDGPTYLQQWLSGEGTTYRKALPDGGFGDKHLPDSVLETPDDKTIVFKFDKPRPDLPQTLAMAGYAVVPEKTDTKEKYDTKPVATGPYKIAEYKRGKSIKLVKNDQWDPKTDSVRHAYVDGFDFTLNHDDKSQTEWLLADRGEAKNGIQFTGAVDATLAKQVIGDPAAKKRTIEGFQPYVWQLNMNMDRIKDKKIRDAIAMAVPNAQFQSVDGGAYGGEVAGGLLAPTLPGFEADYDPFGKLKKRNGDPAAAKKMLEEAGKVGMKLTYAYANTPIRQQQSVILEAALTKAGFDVQKKELDGATWYEQVGKVDNKLDIYMTGWGQDWSSPSTVIPPSFDGTQIQDGSSNYTHLNDPKVNSEIKRIGAITDPEKATEEWNKLHHYIVEEINPAVPIYYTKQFQIYGSNVGGARYSSTTSYIDVTRLFLKK